MTDVSQFKRTLQRISQFNGLANEAQQALASSAVYRHFSGGQVIYLEGEPAESVYILEIRLDQSHAYVLAMAASRP